MMRNDTKYRSLRLIILSLAGMLATAVHAQEASLNGNVLSIPMVAVGNQYYRVDLSIIAGTDPVELALAAGEEISVANGDGASTFANNVLSVPAITVAGIT